MVKQFIKKQPPRIKIILSTEFVANLERVKDYGEEIFGKTVSDRFISEIKRKISLLRLQPDIHPKNRFIESAEKKTYRNIIHESYCILYSVTSTIIDVIDIYYSARAPEYIKTLER
jgi:plasmid stabilization system protein ParE